MGERTDCTASVAGPRGPVAPPRGTGRAHTRPDPAAGPRDPSQRHGAASSCADLTRLRVLWYSLRAPGCDPPGPPGIDYTRDRVQTSPACPTTPHGYGTGHAVDRVALRLAAIARWRADATRAAQALPRVTHAQRRLERAAWELLAAADAIAEAADA